MTALTPCFLGMLKICSSLLDFNFLIFWNVDPVGQTSATVSFLSSVLGLIFAKCRLHAQGYVVPDSCVFFISQMGIRCFTPVSDGHKKTATVHSLLFSPNPTVCTTLIQVKSPSKNIEWEWMKITITNLTNDVLMTLQWWHRLKWPNSLFKVNDRCMKQSETIRWNEK